MPKYMYSIALLHYHIPSNIIYNNIISDNVCDAYVIMKYMFS